LTATPNSVRPIIIGERINPSGNPKLAARLHAGDWDAVDEEARAQADAGADLLDVNGALPARNAASTARGAAPGSPPSAAIVSERGAPAAGSAERASLFEMIDRVERAADRPLVIDSRHPWILVEAAGRTKRVPILSSLTATREALERWLAELGRAHAPVVGLAIDERGVPATAEERFDCAARFVRAGLALGMPLAHLIVDCIALPASAARGRGGGEDSHAAACGASDADSRATPRDPIEADAIDAMLRANAATFDAMRLVASRLGAPLILGISNAAYGAATARERSRRAAAFLAAALDAGLDYAIVNPLDERIRSMLRAARRERGQVAPSQQTPAAEKEKE
jgi:5-methyltetrahydrofolate--homocysteine methyltransferase